MNFYLAASLFFVITTQMASEKEAGYRPDTTIRAEAKDNAIKQEDKTAE